MSSGVKQNDEKNVRIKHKTGVVIHSNLCLLCLLSLNNCMLISIGLD